MPKPKPLVPPSLLTVLLVAVTGCVGAVASLYLPLMHVSTLFLAPVFIAATVRGFGQALWALGLGIGAMCLFYEPVLSFRVSSPQDLVDLAVFAVVALLTARLANDRREQAAVARQREAAVQRLYELSRDIAGARDVDTILDALARHLSEALLCPVAVLAVDRGAVRPSFATHGSEPPPSILQGARDMGSAQTEGAGGRAMMDEGAAVWLLRRLQASDNRGLVAAVRLQSPDPDLIARADAILDEGQLSLRQLGVTRALTEREIRRRTDELNAVLLGSASHELRTPLTSIRSAASVMRAADAVERDPVLVEATEAVLAETGRLDQLIQDLLDVTRLKAGVLVPKAEWIDPADLVNAALERSDRHVVSSQVDLSITSDLPFIKGDPILIREALSQVLANADKHGRPGAPIGIEAAARGGMVEFTVVSEAGAARPDPDPGLFEPFRKGAQGGAADGIGLGLAIARAFVLANAGEIGVSSAPHGGLAFVLRFPEAETGVDHVAE